MQQCRLLSSKHDRERRSGRKAVFGEPTRRRRAAQRRPRRAGQDGSGFHAASPPSVTATGSAACFRGRRRPSAFDGQSRQEHLSPSPASASPLPNPSTHPTPHPLQFSPVIYSFLKRPWFIDPLGSAQNTSIGLLIFVSRRRRRWWWRAMLYERAISVCLVA